MHDLTALETNHDNEDWEWEGAEQELDEADELRVRADVVERVAGKGELDLQMLRVLQDRPVPLRGGRQFFGAGEVAEHVRPRRVEFAGREEVGHDRVAVPQEVFGVFRCDAHGRLMCANRGQRRRAARPSPACGPRHNPDCPDRRDYRAVAMAPAPTVDAAVGA